jgi:xanthine dehydrogenase molybdopterin-binding subunit B
MGKNVSVSPQPRCPVSAIPVSLGQLPSGHAQQAEPVCHARIKTIDTRHAEELPGVYATMTAADLAQPSERLVDLAEGVQHTMRFLSNKIDTILTGSKRGRPTRH